MPLAQNPLCLNNLAGKVRQQVGRSERAVHILAHEVILGGVLQLHANLRIEALHIHQTILLHLLVEINLLRRGRSHAKQREQQRSIKNYFSHVEYGFFSSCEL